MVIKRGPRKEPKKPKFSLIGFSSGPGIHGQRLPEESSKPNKARKKRLFGFLHDHSVKNTIWENSARKISRITAELQRNGVHAPRITYAKGQALITEGWTNTISNSIRASINNVGRTLKENPNLNQKRKNKLLIEASKRIKSLLSKSARQIGKMHAIGYRHEHPHWDNFVFRGSQVGIIDFKYAQKMEIDWGSAKKISGFFLGDHYTLYGEFYDLELEVVRNLLPTSAIPLWNRYFNYDIERQKFMERVINQYPISPATKKAVLQKIVEGIYGDA